MSTIAHMLAAWDEAALTGLVSKGIVIRAGKDAAKATVEMTDSTATVTMGEVTVALTPPDLKAARCSCGLPFACRHVITAVLALRLTAPASSAPPPLTDEAPALPKTSNTGTSPSTTNPPPPVDIAALPFDEIEKHAGKDWPRALAFTTDPAQIIEATEGTRSVTFTETDETVTFPNGLPLKQALFKGAKPGRTRLVVAAAALLLARSAGRDLPENTDAVELKSVEFQLLDRIEQVLFDTARALSTGSVAQASDRLFTSAISTRAQAVPRLAAELRGLSRRMTEDALRQADETPETLLLALSRSHALIRALRKSPDDPALIGRLARSFDPSGPMDVTFLGAEQWQTPAGARGMTMAFLDLKTQRIHRATEARAAGTDLNYHAGMTWHKVLWSAAKPQDLHGRVLHLANAAMAHDGGLGLTQTAQDVGHAPEQLEGLQDWSQLSERFDLQMGRGLRRLAGEALVMLRPKGALAPEFDPYTQKWIWVWFDVYDTPLTLHFPDKLIGSPDRFAAFSRRISAGLVSLSRQGEARLVSLWVTGSGAGQYVLQFNPLPKPQGWTALVDKLHKRIAPTTVKPLSPISPLHLCLERVAEAALGSLSRPIDRTLSDQCKALGLSHIATAVATLDGSAEASLKLGYLLALAKDALGERSV